MGLWGSTRTENAHKKRSWYDVKDRKKVSKNEYIKLPIDTTDVYHRKTVTIIAITYHNDIKNTKRLQRSLDFTMSTMAAF